MDIATKKCVRVVYKYICDLFNTPLNDIYFHEIRRIPTYFNYTFENNTKRSIFKSSVTLKDLEEFYTRFPDQEYSEIRDELKMNLPQLSISYYPDDTWKSLKIMKIKNLVIWNTDDQSSQFLYNFKGERGLFMSCKHIASLCFNIFLKGWINGQNEHLKSRCFLPNFKFHGLNEAELFEGIQIHKIKDSVQRKFDYGPLIEKYDQYLPRRNFLNGTKIERKSDGKLATVFFNEHYFAFFITD
ncbi:hypothetical protein B9Z55_004482 [Caenorhabditis nigoni]|uniref:F-box associated domain-containing protein n=1 Tax=Caenorhabditis nigoni TaxID=1611254 RepID=A0A2G5UWR1_9PELO|nr:hypothetical protein B9Z55_004482 [Caenorhabditis nigoni]